MLTRLNQAGDTIVEVVIAIAIVSLILGGAYATVQKNFANTRNAQERGEALNLAQSQVEILKKVAIDPLTHDKLFGVNGQPARINAFCFGNDGNGSTTTTIIDNATSPGRTTLPSTDSDDFTRYVSTDPAGDPNTGCVYQPQGGTAYYIATEISSNTYITHVRWDHLGGGRSEVTLSYRIYP